MGVYIKGVEMPTDGNGILIDWQGNVSMIGNKIKDVPTAHAVEVSPHGRLIDADALREDWLENGENEYVYDTNDFLESIDSVPTIIEAEGGE